MKLLTGVLSVEKYLAKVVCATAPTADLAKANRVHQHAFPLGFKFIVHGRDGSPVLEVLSYCIDTFLNCFQIPRLKVSENTIDAVIYDICDLLDFLDHCGRSIRVINDRDLKAYVESLCTSASPSTGKLYSKATIERRLSTIKSFLKYCQERAWLQHRFAISTVRHISGRTSEVLEPQIRCETREADDQYVRFIPDGDIASLLDELGECKFDEQGVPVFAPRDRLVAELALQAGLRRAEAASLKVKGVMAVQAAGRDKLSTAAVSVLGKGKKWRSVPVPIWLIQCLQSYICETRAEILKSHDVQHDFIFIRECAAKNPWAPITPRHVTRAFALARARVSSTRSSVGDDLGARRYRCYQFHSLRHTFAIMTYVLRRAMGDTNPGKYVQSVLGHSHQETTDGLYLRASHVLEAEVGELAQRHLMALAV